MIKIGRKLDTYLPRSLHSVSLFIHTIQVQDYDIHYYYLDSSIFYYQMITVSGWASYTFKQVRIVLGCIK